MTNGVEPGYPPAQSMARPQRRQDPLSGILGTFSNPAQVGEALNHASAFCHIVGPVTVGALPNGCEVSLSAVVLNSVDKGGDVYSVGFGKFALTKPAMDRIAAAAGVTTEATQCVRWEQRLCEWRVTRAVRYLDGSTRRESASRIIDLREGSRYLENLRAKAIERDPSRPDTQVNEILGMLGAHTETKARLRADRALLAIRTYTKEELQKPFVVPRLVFTGRCPGNPQLEAAFGMMIAQSMLGATQALYGGNIGPTMQQFGVGQPMQPMAMMGGAMPMQMLQQAPASYPSQGGTVEDFDEETGEVYGAAARPAQAPAPAPRPTTVDPSKTDPARVFMPGKKGVAPLVKDAADKDLTYWHKRLLDGVETSQYADNDRIKIAAIEREQAKRRGEVPPAQEPGVPAVVGSPEEAAAAMQDDPESFPR